MATPPMLGVHQELRSWAIASMIPKEVTSVWRQGSRPTSPGTSHKAQHSSRAGRGRRATSRRVTHGAFVTFMVVVFERSRQQKRQPRLP